MRSKLVPTGDIRAWRKRASPEPEALAIVAGTFDILQPGNLSTLYSAFEHTGNVCVLVEPDISISARLGSTRPWQSAAERMELLTHLRCVNAVVSFLPARSATWLESLRPYTFCHCLSQSDDPLSEAVATHADCIKEAPALRSCFTGDIARSICDGKTPIRLPSGFRSAESGKLPAARNARIRTVSVNGCFDVLHIGHLRFLSSARKMGDRLTVLINNDRSVQRYKGPDRPVFPLRFRTAALMALESVTRVIPFGKDNPLDALAALKPDVHVKGGSYEPDRADSERALVQSWGGRLAFRPMTRGRSTTGFLKSVLDGVPLTP